MTFGEINKLKLDDKIKWLIKNIYFKEYMEEIVDDDEIIRKELIEKIREVIKI
jgi:hypothetical protein